MNSSKLALGLSALIAFGSINFVHADVDTDVATAPQLLLKGTSDAFSGELDLNVITDADGVATSFQTVSSTATSEYPAAQLSTGIVLYNTQGHDVLTAKSADFDPAHGGTVTVTYLTSGISNSYASTSLNIENTGGIWQLMVDDQTGNHVVTEAYFKSAKFFGQVVGISSITFQ